MSRTDGLYSVVERQAVNRILRLAESGDKKRIVRAFKIAEKITPERHRHEVAFVRHKVEEDHPALDMAVHVTQGLSPKARERFVECFIINTMLRGSQKRTDFTQREGVPTPFTILVSPTMRCNLRCEGCFAGEYDRSSDMDVATFQSIVDQANEMGVYLITVLGGEPFFRRDLLDFYGANPDVYFQIYTNGTLLDEATLDRLAELGNIAPMLSLEGPRELTDARRGPGAYDTIVAAMDGLRERGLVFGYSATVTRRNWRTLVGDAFVDEMVARGAALAWNFLYMPVGVDPDVDLMLTAAERNEFRKGILRVRSTKALFPVDFWGDAPYVGGCIAAKHYIHINNDGWVEPCIFTHFATDNVHEVSLKEAFDSPYFREIRRRQPYNHNLLMPCMLIDNPRVAREIMAETGARPTHRGADSLITTLVDRIDDYAGEVERVYAPVWESIACGNDHGGQDVAAPDGVREGAQETTPETAPETVRV